MRRPQSAKPGYKGFWGQGSESEFQQNDNLSKGNPRKNMKLMKPDMTTNDFARILPKKIYQDKERLYSQALQLKQNLNETLEQNIRLKTRITILQKQKDKLTKHIDVGRQNPALKSNSRVNIYNGGNKSGEKENMMIRNLKKMVRENKQQNDFLKQQAAKIKKAIKYTKINQLQIERKMLQEENKRLSVLLEEMNKQLGSQDQCERQNSELKRYLQDQQQANKELNQANLKYMEYIQQLEQKLASQQQKFHTKQNKLQRQLALTKRKLNQSNKQSQQLRKQMTLLKQQSSSKVEIKKPKITRPVTSNPYKSQGLVGVRLATETKKEEGNKQNEQIKNIQLENQLLKEELSRTKVKLEETEREFKRQRDGNSLSQLNTDLKNNTCINKQQQKPNPTIHKQNIDEAVRSSDKDVKLNPLGPKTLSSDIIRAHASPNFDQKSGCDKDYEEQQNYQEYQNDYEEDQHKEIEENSKSVNNQSKKQKPKVQTNKKQQNLQIDQYRKDFQAEDDEENIYVKEDSNQKKMGKKQAGKKKKDKKQSSPGYKPDKKILSEIKQLLTYRMKAQRYPYEQLKRDILQAKQKQFSLSDLKGMFVSEPFYMTAGFCDALIQYCFQMQKPKADQIISNDTLLSKLRKVIDQFILIEEKDEEEMLLRIAEMVTEYPQELESAFEKIKNGEETVCKADLREMFQNLQLQDKYIEIIIQELSLCSGDLEHLNYIGFFQRFYVQNMTVGQNGQIDQEQMESSSEDVSKNLKSKDTKKLKQTKQQFQDNDEDLVVDDGQRISLGSKQYDEADVVSDDGPV